MRTPAGEVMIDAGGRANGRGAYICNNSECLKKAIRSKALGRALKIEIPDEILEALVKEIENGS